MKTSIFIVFLIIALLFSSGCTSTGPISNDNTTQSEIHPIRIGEETTLTSPTLTPSTIITKSSENVSLKLNSAKKATKLYIKTPNDPSNIYLVLNIGITNNGIPKGFEYDYNSLYIVDLTNNVRVSQNTKYDGGVVPNALVPTRINLGDTRTGDVTFVVKGTSESYKLTLVGNNGLVFNSLTFDVA
jgi:hypothetical protein